MTMRKPPVFLFWFRNSDASAVPSPSQGSTFRGWFCLVRCEKSADDALSVCRCATVHGIDRHYHGNDYDVGAKIAPSVACAGEAQKKADRGGSPNQGANGHLTNRTGP